MKIWQFANKMELNERGQCGICGLGRPLHEIQNHFLETHVENNIPNTENVDSEHSDNSDVLFTNDHSSEAPVLRWPREHVLLLIRMVESKTEMFNFSTLKKHVWIKIAVEISETIGKVYTADQVDNKWKGLKKTYKNIKDHNNKTGNNTKKWEFYYAMDSFMNKKPEVSPLALCSSSSGLKVNEAPGPSSASSSGISSTDTESFNSAIIRKRKRVENINQKKEKLARFDEFLKLYRASVEHQLGKKVE